MVKFPRIFQVLTCFQVVTFSFPLFLSLFLPCLLTLGAHFGSTFPHLLLFTYPDLVPDGRTQIYKPKIFGFRVNERSIVGPQLQWLRLRPEGEEVQAKEDDDTSYNRSRDEESSLAGKVSMDGRTRGRFTWVPF